MTLNEELLGKMSACLYSTYISAIQKTNEDSLCMRKIVVGVNTLEMEQQKFAPDLLEDVLHVQLNQINSTCDYLI